MHPGWGPSGSGLQQTGSFPSDPNFGYGYDDYHTYQDWEQYYDGSQYNAGYGYGPGYDASYDPNGPYYMNRGGPPRPPSLRMPQPSWVRLWVVLHTSTNIL